MVLICENQIYCSFILLWFLGVKGNYIETKYNFVYFVNDRFLSKERLWVADLACLSLCYTLGDDTHVSPWLWGLRMFKSFKTSTNVYDVLQMLTKRWLLCNSLHFLRLDYSSVHLHLWGHRINPMNYKINNCVEHSIKGKITFSI